MLMQKLIINDLNCHSNFSNLNWEIWSNNKPIEKNNKDEISKNKEPTLKPSPLRNIGTPTNMPDRKNIILSGPNTFKGLNWVANLSINNIVLKPSEIFTLLLPFPLFFTLIGVKKIS